MVATPDTPTSVDHTGTTTASPWTLAHTGVAGSILIVKITLNGAASVVTGVTFNGVAMTQIGAIANGTNTLSAIYKLANPSVGSFNVSVSLSASSRGSIVATCWSDVDIAGTPNGAFASTTGSAAAVSLASISTGATEVVTDSLGGHAPTSASAINPTNDASQTLEARGFTASAAALYFGGSYKTNGSTMAWTVVTTGTAAAWAIGAVSLKPAPDPFPPVPGPQRSILRNL